MTNHDEHRFDETPAGWDSLAARLARPAVDDVEVSRLRARVRGALPAPRGGFAWRLLQFASASGIAVAALVALVHGIPRTTDMASVMDVQRGDDGAVVIRFADNRAVHTIRESDVARKNGTGLVHVARGKQFVDKDEQAQPGSITFYRVD